MSNASHRILILTTSYPAFSGDLSGHFVLADAESRERLGPVVVAAAGRGEGSLDAGPEVNWLGGARLFSYPGVLARVRTSPWSLIWLPLVLVRAARVLARHRGPVVAHWLVPFGLLAAWIERWTHTAPEIIAHGSDVRLLMKAPNWLREKIVQELKRARSSLTFVSRELRTEFSEDLSPDLVDYLSEAQIAPAPLDLSRAPADQKEARKLLQLAPDETVVVVIGRLIPTKRIAVALVAALLIPKANVVCIGDGPLRDELERDFEEVRFVGRCNRDRALAWIRAADVLLSASKLEGAPSIVREAMALGTSVVSPPIGDLELWAQDSELLFLVRKGSDLAQPKALPL
jgi:teichuronic acid biosynthesis glycosyltransferase TuaC